MKKEREQVFISHYPKISMKILVIDDNKDITDLLVKVLSIVGHTVKASNNGRDGLDNILNDKYDIVFLDIAMPDFSGLDVIDRLVKYGKVSSTKIVLFTASSITDEEVNKLINLGIHSCLRKPIRIETLLSKINEIANG